MMNEVGSVWGSVDSEGVFDSRDVKKSWGAVCWGGKDGKKRGWVVCEIVRFGVEGVYWASVI